MSVGIVRVQKFTKGSVKGVEIHDRRLKEGVSHTNPDIDWERSRENYDLCPAQNTNFLQAVKERIEQLPLKRAVRKDAIVMAQVLVTSDWMFFETMTPDDTRDFFKDAYAFLSERYGPENIISAVVHMDEQTPHMHVNFVPATEDGHLSAKRILTRESLIEQQTAFQNAVGAYYGLQRGKTREERMEQGLERKHMETAEYKAYAKQLNALREKVEHTNEILEDAQKKVTNNESLLSKHTKELQQVSDAIGAAKRELGETRDRLDVEKAGAEGAAGAAPMELLKEHRKLLGGEPTVEISKADFERGQIAIKALESSQKALKAARMLPSVSDRQNAEQALNRRVRELLNHRDVQDEEIEKLKRENRTLRSDAAGVALKLRSFKARVEDMIVGCTNCSRKAAKETVDWMIEYDAVPRWADPDRDAKSPSYDDLER